MSEEKINEVVNALSGLKNYEWARIKKAVQNIMDSKYAHLELDDKEKIRTNIKLELGSANIEES